MKLSIVISTQPAKFNALAYKGHLAENIAKIRSLGYDGVELAVRDPRSLDLKAIKAITIDDGFSVSAIGTGQAYGEEGLSFSDPDEKIRCKAINRIKSHLDLAEELNAIVIIGLVRGVAKPEVNTGKAEEWIFEALEECSVQNPDVRLAIEPCNRYEANMINSAKEGLQLIEQLHLPNVGLLLDTFHMNIEEPDIQESILKSGENLFHFHIADSNRWYPGAGHIDFRSVVEQLRRIKYDGYLSAEIMPLPDADTAAQKTIEYMRRFGL
jgi:sugar phosphate isomerase/epimerase